MAASEAMLGYEYLMTTLKGDATLMSYVTGGFYRNFIPPGTPTPYGIVSYQSGRDITTVNAYRLFASMLFQVIVVGPASLTVTNHVPAASRIDTLIGHVTGVPLTADSLGLVLTCYRESPVSRDEEVNAEDWLNLGGLYRMQIQAIG